MGKYMRLIFCMVLLVAFVGCKEQSTERDDWALFKKQHKVTARYYEDVKLGFSAYKQRQIKKAVTHLGSAMQKGCKDPLVQYKLGVVRRAQDKLDEALRLFKMASKGLQNLYSKHPYAGTVWLNMGNIFYLKKEYKKALALYEKSHKIIGNTKDINFYLGMVYNRLKKYTQAAAFLEKSDRNQFRVAYYLGGVYHKLKRLDDALHTMERAVTMRPRSKRALQALANFYSIKAEQFEKKKNYAQALKYYTFSGRCFGRAIDAGEKILKVYLRNVISKTREMRQKLK